MAQHLRLANTGVVYREIGDWAETDTAMDILRTFECVRAMDKPSMSYIAGASGIGKTIAAKRFCETLGHDAIYIEAARGEGTVWNFAKMLAGKWFGTPHFNTHYDAREWFARSIGRGRLVVVDEAQYLYQKNRKTGQIGEAFEWIRAMAEMGEFDVVFVGDLTLPRSFSDMPQFAGRMLRERTIKHANKADVVALVAQTPFANPQAIEVLTTVAKLTGGLRNVNTAVQYATMLAADKQPTNGHLKAAIEDLALASRGGRS